ncbi:MAG: response regulator [Acidobacteriota bacterium]|nr:response regulator [Acidobacteriota bacterium]
MKILVVDDDRTSRAFFRRELAEGGYDILEAGDGFEAIHVIHAEDVDMVILDIEMPDMDGYQVCTWLRSEQFSQRLSQKSSDLLPIVFVTSSESLESRLKGFRAGATDFITKSFKPGTLLKLANRILRPRNVLESMTALLVDDSKLVRDMVNEMLREQGVKVIEATNGQQGYELLLENLEQIDMVITDLEMPIMKGDELCFKIRMDLGLKDLPVIFLTAVPDRDVLISLFKAGANDYLVKPFVKEELIARLKVIQEMFQNLDEEVKERKRAQADLAHTRKWARDHMQEASKIDLANTVLHNVNNVLNSVSVSCGQLTTFLAESRLSQLLLALKLLEKNADDLPKFFSQDVKGKKLPEYFKLVSGLLEAEHQQMYEEVRELGKKIKLMKDIVDTQQKVASKETRTGNFDIAVLVQNALAVNESLLRRFDVKVDRTMPEEAMVRVPEVEFIHILINLIKNAVEAMEESSLRRLEINCREKDEKFLELSIKDTGPGIAPEHLESIFEKGFTTKSSGHGFGLPYCCQVMKDMGGDIQVTGKQGKGAIFTLKVPRPIVKQPGLS